MMLMTFNSNEGEDGDYNENSNRTPYVIRSTQMATFWGTEFCSRMCSINVFNVVKDFSNSLIIHEEKTKEIPTVKEVWLCDPDYHKIW